VQWEQHQKKSSFGQRIRTVRKKDLSKQKPRGQKEGRGKSAAGREGQREGGGGFLSKRRQVGLRGVAVGNRVKRGMGREGARHVDWRKKDEKEG